MHPLIVFLAWASWLGAVLLAIWPPDRPSGPSSHGSWANETWRGQALFALVFAPLGCLLRFYASLKLNGLVPSFPLGTFAVNMLGTAVEARRRRGHGSGGWWKGGLPGAAGGSGRVLRVLDDGQYVGGGDPWAEKTAWVYVCGCECAGGIVLNGGYYGECAVECWVELAGL
ncbi:hypothetical protein LTR87_014003 [Friedmanniomyces endolithicus]|nr:hypothetical protein LTR87_014003 [Friedmanniomyces endolithicus]